MLKFNEKIHQYTLDDKVLISTTQLMKKHGLAPNYDGVSATVLKNKASRGTLIHKEIENYIKLKEIGFSKECELFIAYKKKSKIVVDESECMVHNDIVAGTIDLVLHKGKQNIIADIKTTYQLHYESVSWQLSIYLYLYLEYDKRIPDENWDGFKGQVFHFTKDGTLEVIDIPLKPVYEVIKLMDCERKGVNFEIELATADVEEFKNLECLLNDLEQKKNEIKEKQEKIKERLLEEMKKRNLKTFERNGVRISYTGTFKKKTLDTKKLEAEHPKIYKKYLKETEVKETIKITLKKEKENE